MSSTNPDPFTPQGPNLVTGEDTSAAAAANTSQVNAVRDLASAINSNANEVGVLVIKGVVSALEPSGTPTFAAYLSGDSSVAVSGIRYLDSYSPVVGDVVALIKSGSELFCLGQYNNSTGGGDTANGWTPPTLGAGFTTNAFDPVKWRVVIDNGDKKVQLRGGVTVSGSPTTLWTMPTEHRPIFNKPVLLIGRDDTGGSVVAGLQVNANGTLTISAGTTGIKGTSADGGFSGNVSTQSHGNLATGLVDTTAVNPHFHITNAASHTHSISVGDHTHANISVTYPTMLSFNGIEYFL